MRIFHTLLMLFLICAIALPQDASAGTKRKSKKAAQPAASLGVNDPRYAALIMDPQTGEILHQKNADERRYPASLTKMMTLYLLFDALKAGKLNLDDTMDVSENAARQPQTNIHLNPGDDVPVELAIKAIVVRSANDVSIVVAEELGGSVTRFAKAMNEKAEALGMKNTHFENPNGLPDPEQYTTARDMAKLGIALKRDFPEYYPYFATREFSWNGATYYTHNRVMLRYSGVDGIKTGYINKAGFNLVTSAVRGGRPLIGVVLGGTSGRWRDDQMISLLNSGYTVLASRGQQRGKIYAQNLPRLPDGQPITVQQAANSDEAVRSTIDLANVEADRGAVREAMAASSPFAVVDAMAQGDISEPTDVAAAIAPAAARASHSVVAEAAVRSMLPEWGIQIGAFSNKSLAEKAVQQAKTIAAAALKTSKLAPLASKNKTKGVYRARIENLSELQAREACSKLLAKNSPCFVYRAGTQNL